jgi:hypothetical protein
MVHPARASRLPAAQLIAESGPAGGVSRSCEDVAAELGPMAEIACLCRADLHDAFGLAQPGVERP